MCVCAVDREHAKSVKRQRKQLQVISESERGASVCLCCSSAPPPLVFVMLTVGGLPPASLPLRHKQTHNFHGFSSSLENLKSTVTPTSR